MGIYILKKGLPHLGQKILGSLSWGLPVLRILLVRALNLVYRLGEACDGDLDRVDVVLRLGGFVNCLPGFAHSPAVINGATEVFLALFGDQDWHARTAVGVSGLPGNAAVEVDAIVRLKPY